MAVIGAVLVKRIVIDRGNFTASSLVMNAQRSKLYDCRTPLFSLLTLCKQPTIEMVSAILSFVPLGKDSCVSTPGWQRSKCTDLDVLEPCSPAVIIGLLHKLLHVRFDLVLHAARVDTSNWNRDVNGGHGLHGSAVRNVKVAALPLSTTRSDGSGCWLLFSQGMVTGWGREMGVPNLG
jgi:hypothetical protein